MNYGLVVIFKNPQFRVEKWNVQDYEAIHQVGVAEVEAIATPPAFEKEPKKDKKQRKHLPEKFIWPKVLIQEGKQKMRINNWAPVSRGGSLTGRILISKRKRWRIVRARGRSNPSGPLISISKTKLSTMSSFPLCRYRSLFAFRCSRVKTRLKIGSCHFMDISKSFTTDRVQELIPTKNISWRRNLSQFE